MKVLRTLGIGLGSLLALVALASAGQWQPLKNPLRLSQNGAGPGAMLLLTDGTVLVHEEQLSAQSWYKLTPDVNGSYVNGTWSQLATMPAGYGPVFFGSVVLPDGRVVVEGGEYNCLPDCQAVWTNQGAIYDPAKDKWTSVNPPSGWANIGDAQNIILPDGTYMQANCCAIQQAYFNPKTLGWTNITNTGKADSFDEEGWLLLPDGNVLTTDAVNAPHYEIYNPKTKKWKVEGITPVRLEDPSSEEIGPMVLRPDGTVFASGAAPAGNNAGHTAIYNTKTGKWTAGPDFPKDSHGNLVACDDAPAAVEINGNVLVMASPPVFHTPASFFEWDGKKLTRIPGPPNAAIDPAFVGHFLVLPTGQILFSDYSLDTEVFTPKGTYNKAWAPKITSAPSSVTRGKTYVVKGTQFSGLSQGAGYGDDFQDATNYALVRITNKATKHVFYARTTNPSSYALQTGTMPESTHFTVSPGTETGASSLVVVTNGIPSPPVAVTVN